jgi:hypothetical protein
MPAPPFYQIIFNDELLLYNQKVIFIKNIFGQRKSEFYYQKSLRPICI